MALHTGPAEEQDGDYHGPVVNRVARLEGIAHGGQTLVSESTRALTRDDLPHEVSLTDLGVHRLRGLDRPERVYQLEASDLRDSFPPLRSAESQGVPLPRFPTSFVGRASELNEVGALLGDNQLVTLLGPGGIGKTRLAVESARALESTLPGGAVFVDLAPVSTEDVPLAIAEAVGAHPEGTASVLSLVSGRVVQPTLMLLDNFEHVLGAGPMIADLMAQATPLTMLATSRSPLHIRGERIYRLAPLDTTLGEEGDMPPAVQLFYERARSHGVAISQTTADRAAVDAICRRLDGLPLAIELAAARTRIFSVVELADRLAGSLDALGAGAADLPARQRTIRATIDWSLEGLEPPQQSLFEALSVFPAGARLVDIEGVASGSDDVLSDLESLVDASLVNVTQGLPGGTRYRQLVPLREYAAERLAAAGATDIAMNRVVDHLLDVAPGLGRRLATDPSAERELTVDNANLMVAMRWSLDHGRAEDMVQIISDVWINFFNGDKAGPVLQWTEHAAQSVNTPRLDWLVGFFAFQTGDYEVASVHLARAADGFALAGDEQWLALARSFSGVLDPDLEIGRRTLEAAVAYFEADASVYGYVSMLFLSANAVQRGAFDEALSLRRRVLEATEKAHYPVLIAWAHWNLALVLYGTGDVTDATRHNDIALRQMVVDGYQEGIASCGGMRALIEFSAGRRESAVMLMGATQP